MKQIPEATLIAATAMLMQFCPVVSPANLVKALRDIEASTQENERAATRKTMTFKDACAMLHLSRPTVEKLCREGKLKKIKIGKRALIEANSMNELMQKN